MTINVNPVHLLFDGDAVPPVTGADATTSRVALGAKAVQVDAMTGAADVRVQGRIDDGCAWVDLQALTESSVNQLVTFPVPVNQLRVIGLVAGARVVAML